VGAVAGGGGFSAYYVLDVGCEDEFFVG
jgi:hypothetical protein